MAERVTRLAVLNEGLRELEFLERPVPAPPPGGVVLRVELAGVCGTDVHFWNGAAPFPAPMVLGHEGVGVIVELGSGAVTDHAGVPVREGDRVVWVPLRVCDRCYACTVSADPTACANVEYYCGPDEPNWAAFADLVWLTPDIRFYRIPDDTPSEAVAAFGCALPTMLEALERAGGIRPHESVVVQGSGPVGLAATFLASVSGAARVVTIGAPPHRLEAARAFGADHTIDIAETTSPDERVELARGWLDGRGADVVIEATGVLQAFDEGLSLVAKGGRYIVVGLWSADGNVTLSPSRLNNDNLKIVGSSLAHPKQYHRAVLLTQRHHRSYPLAEAVTGHYPLERTADALDAAARMESIKAVIAP